MDVSLFDFDLPEERIALRPAVPRDSARMLVAYPDGRTEHRLVRDLPDYLRKGDALVLNDTRVMPARLRGARLRCGTAAKIEILLHRRLAEDRYSALARPAKKLAVGDALDFDGLVAHVAEKGQAGELEIKFALAGTELDSALAMRGEMPLPPYIAAKRPTDAQDLCDYQTVYAHEQGSAAAPTAGLHFTPQLLAALEMRGVSRETVTLHVGLGTFLPVTSQDTRDHRMHPEHARLAAGTAARLNGIHAQGGRICAVGTTALRTLESAVGSEGLRGIDLDTSIFITPGYQFGAVDLLLTNFHLPRSTLFMLVSAFMGTEVMQKVYAEAIRGEYRFYSYGDACLLIRHP